MLGHFPMFKGAQVCWGTSTQRVGSRSGGLVSETELEALEHILPPESVDPRTVLSGLVKDLLLGLVLIGGGVFAIYYVHTQKAVFVIAGGLRFHSIPTICGSLLVGLVAINLFNVCREMMVFRASVGRDRFATALRGVFSLPQLGIDDWQRIGTIAGVIVFVFLLRYTPFFAAAAIFLAAMFLLFGQRRYLRIAVVSLAGSAALTLLFIYGLRLPL
jgi:hypothetical protein